MPTRPTSSPHAATPAAQGYRMPAEWAPHQGTWISWPHNPDTWPGFLPGVVTFYDTLTRALAEVEEVHINVTTRAMRRDLEQRFAEALARGRVILHDFPTDDAWCRDHGATIVKGPAGRAAIDWRYTAWGGKYPPYDSDDRIAALMAEYLGIPVFRQDVVLEGGALEINSQGLLLTTASCVLNPNRNPDLTHAAADRLLRDTLGATEVLWLEGEILGDDTDGHIDNLARFVNDDTVFIEPRLEASSRAVLADYRTPAGGSLTVRELPLPAPQQRDGEPLPASFANFLIANELVLVPGYGGSEDERACAMLQEHFPDRDVRAIDARAAIVGLGAIHCLTQQVPA
ncbi:MAG: agmatine deiminase family protein [Rhodothermales bacterium]